MDNIIEISNIKFEYCDIENGNTVLDNFSLSIERGSFVVVLGHNGSGKSTVAKLMTGLIKPSSGTVSVDLMSTLDSQYETEIHRRVGMVFQNPDNQIVSSIVEEDVAFGPENLGIEPSEIRLRVDNALKAVDMYEYRLASPNTLSGGQKQRVAIAGIIAMEPECIVLDEPTAMLDPRGRKEVIDTVYRLNKEKGITVVLITHYMEEAENADRVIVMNDGVIMSDGTPKEVFSDTDLIKNAGLNLPQTTELLSLLSKKGFKVEKGIISEEECKDEIVRLLSGCKNCQN